MLRRHLGCNSGDVLSRKQQTLIDSTRCVLPVIEPLLGIIRIYLRSSPGSRSSKTALVSLDSGTEGWDDPRRTGSFNLKRGNIPAQKESGPKTPKSLESLGHQQMAWQIPITRPNSHCGNPDVDSRQILVNHAGCHTDSSVAPRTVGQGSCAPSGRLEAFPPGVSFAAQYLGIPSFETPQPDLYFTLNV